MEVFLFERGMTQAALTDYIRAHDK
jgi:hypothetical protein